MIEILRNEGNFVAVKLSGRLLESDYRRFAQVIASAAEKGKLHQLVDLRDFEGWDRHTVWDALRLDTELARKIERLAFLYDKHWESWVVELGKPFTRGEIQTFEANDARDAWAWVQDGLQDY